MPRGRHGRADLGFSGPGQGLAPGPAIEAEAAPSDLTSHAIEVNLFHYGPGAWLGPHVDLKDKLVTHVFYFNGSWNREDGGCLQILRSAADAADADTAAIVEPTVGNSAVLVRSDHSWHAVSRVREGCRLSRRSMTVTFYHPDSISTMWPPGDATPVHDYDPPAEQPGRWARVLKKIWPAV